MEAKTVKTEAKKVPEELHNHYYPDGRGGYYAGAPPAGWGGSWTHHEAPKSSKRSAKPTIAGILLVLTAICGLVLGGLLVGFGAYAKDGYDDSWTFDWTDDNEGDVTGTVMFSNRTPVEGANVTILDEDKTAVTDDLGNFLIYNVESGERTVRVEKAGYNTLEFTVYVSPEDAFLDESSNLSNGPNHRNYFLTPGSDTVKKDKTAPIGLIKGAAMGCGTVMIVLSVVTLLGAVHAFRRKRFGVAMTGAVCGIFTGVGVLFSLIAVFVLALSRDEFESTKEAKK